MCGCGCLFALLAGVTPRLALGLVWIFSEYVERAFDSFIVPFLGLVFLPYTTLFYVLVYDPTGMSLFGIMFVVFGFLLDLGAYASKAYTNRETISTMEYSSPTEAASQVVDTVSNPSSASSSNSSSTKK